MTEDPHFDAARKEKILFLSPLTAAFFDDALFRRNPQKWRMDMNALYMTIENQMRSSLHWSSENPAVMLEGFRRTAETVNIFPGYMRNEEREGVLGWILAMGFEIGDTDETSLFYSDMVKTLSIRKLVQEDIQGNQVRQQDLKSVVVSVAGSGSAFKEYIKTQKHLYSLAAPDEFIPPVTPRPDSERLKPFEDFLKKIL